MQMVDSLIQTFAADLPKELRSLLHERISEIENGNFHAVLRSPTARLLFGHERIDCLEDTHVQDFTNWSDFIFHRLGVLLSDRKDDPTSAIESPSFKQNNFFLIAYAALLAFLQSNVTGPVLPFSSSELLLGNATPGIQSRSIGSIRQGLVASLSVDGIAAYKLTPNVELLCLADTILSCPPINKHVPLATWAKLRVTFTHQRLLSEPSSTLQAQIYGYVDELESSIDKQQDRFDNLKIHLLLEKAAIDTFHGSDRQARASLDQAAKIRNFQFALTGALGKRTRFQQHDLSQLVVLAKSAEAVADKPRTLILDDETTLAVNGNATKPETLDLNDDTLLESVSFTQKQPSSTDITDPSSLAPALASLDPSSQPQLQALDSVILLSLASSITNTSPADGLTREETLPYATRVLEGGSSNWQVYTQALLVRSRIEGYKSRTIERGLLQLQTLVDQIIAETTPSDSDGTHSTAETRPTSFLPQPKASESAPVQERLQYVFQLASPARWELEAELAQRWVSLGGFRSALEIYERLEMWAEAALCWAATEREDRGRRIIRKQLFHATNDISDDDIGDDETWEGEERSPAPLDGPRLYCILGDLDQDPTMYEKAWDISGQRYARAQRSIGRFYFAAKDYVKAAEGYSKSLKVNRLNHGSWFALGCALLELGQFEKAVEAFSRCVQLDEQDAEAWSNLAAALLKQDPPESADGVGQTTSLDDDDDDVELIRAAKVDLQKNKKDALKALKRAATLKHESFRIWDNVLIVAASISPPDYLSIVSAQRQLINLRSSSIGEKCIDIEIMELMVQRIISSEDSYDASKPGFERLLVEMFDKQIVPLITGSHRLWQLVAKLAIWRGKPASALDAQEKAWRAVTTQPGWETDKEARWDDVVDATVELCDAYESLGPREKTEGLGAGNGALVAKDWKFKARSAIRGIMGRGKQSWEDTPGWTRLKDQLDQLRN